MKKSLLLFSLLLFGCQLWAQSVSFSNIIGGSIPDAGPEVCFPISVSGLPAQIDMTYGIVSVCLNITHTYDADLKIRLKSPSGLPVVLSNQNGGGGDNYTGTCFKQNGTNGAISGGIPPFMGDYVPDNNLNTFNTNINPNGIWELCVQDVYAIDTGAVLNVTLTFDNNPPVGGSGGGGLCSYTNAFSCKCPDTTLTICELRPDMTNSSLIIANEHTEYAGMLTVSTATPNIGWGPLEMHGIDSCFCGSTPVPCSTTTCIGGGSPKQMVIQRIYKKNGATMSYYDIPAGFMQFHPSHGHMHIDHWVENTIRIRGPQSNPTLWPIVGKGNKVSFCLINLGDCTTNNGYCKDTLGNTLTMANIPNSPFGMVSGCDTAQGIFTGNLDIYDQGIPGQDITLPSNLCNGQYYIVSHTDPQNIVVETNDNNNWSATPITLTLQGGGNCCQGGFKADTLTGLAPFQVAFQDTTKPIPASWHWDFGDGGTSVTQFPTHIYTTPGTYTVTLITQTAGGCIDTTVTTTYISVGGVTHAQQEVLEVNRFVIAPNPSQDVFTLNYELVQPQAMSISIYSLYGQKLHTVVQNNQSQGKYTESFSAHGLGLPAGVYMLQVQSNSQLKSYKVVIME